MTTYGSSAEAEYIRSTPRSRALHEQAARVMPGGTTRGTVYFAPYPLCIARGSGPRIWDVDGNEKIDFILNYTALVIGHAHPAVVAAIRTQSEKGTAFAGTNETEVELAGELCRRVPSLESVRFCNSGTEATMFALRAARAFMRRPKIARFEGGYHGTHDFAEVSTHPDPAGAGPAASPHSVPDSIGTHPAILDNVIVLPFNDSAGVERALRAHRDELAALIVEPVLGAGGVIPPREGFLAHLRSLTRELGIVLIFDEIISLRLASGGAQQLYGVSPDLTTMGKIIGGGLPVGAFGGRADIMAIFDVRREGHLPHGGTFNGNPLVAAAGLATLRQLTPAAFAELDRGGEWLRAQLRAVFRQHDIPAQITGVGSLVGIHFTPDPVYDYRAAASADKAMARDFFFGMLVRGSFFAPRGMVCLSTVTSQTELQAFVDAAAAVAPALQRATVRVPA